MSRCSRRWEFSEKKIFQAKMKSALVFDNFIDRLIPKLRLQRLSFLPPCGEGLRKGVTTSTRYPQFRWRRSFIRSPYPDLPPQETVSQCVASGLSSRTDVRDLRFLPAVEMTEGPMQSIFLVLRHSLQGEKEATTLRPGRGKYFKPLVVIGFLFLACPQW